MKFVMVFLSLLLLFSTTASAVELQIKTDEINGNTVITCHIPSEMGKIDMAYIQFHGDKEKVLPSRNCEMEITGDNEVRYTAVGIHQVLEGKVQILLTDLSKEIIKKDFLIKN